MFLPHFAIVIIFLPFHNLVYELENLFKYSDFRILFSIVEFGFVIQINFRSIGLEIQVSIILSRLKLMNLNNFFNTFHLKKSIHCGLERLVKTDFKILISCLY